VTTVASGKPKQNLPLIFAFAAAGIIIVPALVYTALHPAAVTTTVKQLAHVAMPIKNIGRVAIVATRVTPTPHPSPSPTASATPANKKPTPAQLAHQAHLKHAALAAALLHTRKIASSGETSDVSSRTAGSADAAGGADTMTVATTRAPQSAAATPAAVAAAQQQPAADATPVYAPDTVVDARFIHEVQPDYPEIAKEQGAAGTAVVFATVGPKGNVISTRIDQSTGNRLLDQAALSAARESSFEAPEINGREATETYRIVYTFAL
jgi:TonB family protein